MKKIFIIFGTLLIVSFVSKAQSNILSKGNAEILPSKGAENLLQETINTQSFTFIPLRGTATPVPVNSPSEGTFPKGSFAVNLGIGLGNIYWGAGYGSGLPVSPTLIVDYAITDKLGIGNISVGGTVAYSSSKYSGYNFSGILIGLRGSYHFILDIEKLDPYAGVLLGYIITSNPSYNGTPGFGPKASAVQPGVFAGAHYFFEPHFGVFAELGFNGFSIFDLGVTFKF